MKIGTIQLEAHDNLISIRERIISQEDQRFLLLMPEQGGLTLRRLDLKAFLRQVETLGMDFGLVTVDPDLSALARQLEIPVFSSIEQAENAEWVSRKPARLLRRSPRVDLRASRDKLPVSELFDIINSPARRAAIFAIGVLAVLAVLLVLLPAADVQISLPEQKQTLTIVVSAEENAPGVLISGMIPLKKIEQIVEGSASARASGSATLPDQTAVGQVILLNLTDEAVSVPAKTVLLSNSKPPVSFLTENFVLVPAGKGKTARVSIRAALPGPDGNVDPGVVTFFDGALGNQLSVINPEPISGGTLVTATQPTQQDRDSLRKRLLADLQRQAQTVFAGKMSNGDLLFPATISRVRVVEEVYTPAFGETGEKVALVMRVEYAAFYADHADLRLLAGLVLNASIPEGSLAVSDAIDLQPVSDFQVGQGVVRWQMRAWRNLQPQVDEGQVITHVLGKSRAAATQNLINTYSLQQQPRIDVRPGWWPWLPLLPIRIAVKG